MIAVWRLLIVVVCCCVVCCVLFVGSGLLFVTGLRYLFVVRSVLFGD